MRKLLSERQRGSDLPVNCLISDGIKPLPLAITIFTFCDRLRVRQRYMGAPCRDAMCIEPETHPGSWVLFYSLGVGYSEPPWPSLSRPLLRTEKSHFGPIPTTPVAPRAGPKRLGAGYGFYLKVPRCHLASLEDPRAC